MFIKARSITASQTGRIYDSNLLLHQNQCLANGEETIYGLDVSSANIVIRQYSWVVGISLLETSLSDYVARDLAANSTYVKTVDALRLCHPTKAGLLNRHLVAKHKKHRSEQTQSRPQMIQL